MSNKFLKTYSGFQRNILREIFDEEMLKKLDHIYNVAKIKRATKREMEELLKIKNKLKK